MWIVRAKSILKRHLSVALEDLGVFWDGPEKERSLCALEQALKIVENMPDDPESPDTLQHMK